MEPFDAPSSSKSEWEVTSDFTPRFDDRGLITVITVDASDKTVLMVAHMNAPALQRTLETGIVHYYSRSRAAIWKKGETSGNLQTLVEMRTDCDQDAIIVMVKPQKTGAACHTGRRSCFYRTVELGKDGKARLLVDETDQPRFDPAKIYRTKT